MAVVRRIRATEESEESLDSLTESLASLSSASDFGSRAAKYQSRSGNEAESIETIADETNDANSHELRPRGRRLADFSLDDGQSGGLRYPREGVEILPISKWTSVQGSDRQFCELLALLWTWDTTFTRVIDRSTFEDGLQILIFWISSDLTLLTLDLRNGAHQAQKDSTKRQFCSTFLVDALLGFACVRERESLLFRSIIWRFLRAGKRLTKDSGIYNV